jgi:hypothetical protein
VCRLVAGALAVAAGLCAQSLSERWDAVVTIGGLRVPFILHFEGKGPAFAASLAKGDTRVPADASSFDGKTLRAEFRQPRARIEAVLSDGELKGVFGNEKTAMYPFKASAFCTCGFVGEAGPDISGSWEIREDGWRLLLRRVGEDTIAAIARGANETGPLTGRFNGVFFELSFFDGQQGAVLEIEPRKDGGLDLSLMEPGAAAKKMKAVRTQSTQQ